MYTVVIKSQRWTLGFALILLSAHVWADMGGCGAPGTTRLDRITGANGDPLPEGREVVIEAPVSASFPGQSGLNGFFIESGTPPVGVFVYAPKVTPEAAPQTAERWRLRARTGRYRGRIQLERVEELVRCGPETVKPTTVSAKTLNAPGALANRLIRLEGPLTITGTYQLGRYGSMRLAQGGRAFARNTGVEGGKPLSFVLDDGSYRRDPRPVPYLDSNGVRRAGDRLESVTGVITHAFGEWRIHPVAPPAIRAANPRPIDAPRRSADSALRVVQFNLQNYFIDRGGRGPATAAGFQRQRTRLRTTLRALDADLLVLHEIQNKTAAVDDLLDWLNEDQAPALRYQVVLAERSAAAIRTVMLFRPARLTLSRAARHTDEAHARDPIAAVFHDAQGEALMVAGAHFKSRSGCPDRGDVDRGEGCWADRREAEAVSLVRWLNDWVEARSLAKAPVLVLADLNAYAQEQPVQRLLDAGLVDQLAQQVPAPQRYSYVYRGRAGYLDHVLATDLMATRIRSVALWPINADEPAYLAREGEGIWRASDHDPLIIDLK